MVLSSKEQQTTAYISLEGEGEMPSSLCLKESNPEKTLKKWK